MAYRMARSGVAAAACPNRTPPLSAPLTTHEPRNSTPTRPHPLLKHPLTIPQKRASNKPHTYWHSEVSHGGEGCTVSSVTPFLLQLTGRDTQKRAAWRDFSPKLPRSTGVECPTPMARGNSGLKTLANARQTQCCFCCSKGPLQRLRPSGVSANRLLIYSLPARMPHGK